MGQAIILVALHYLQQHQPMQQTKQNLIVVIRNSYLKIKTLDYVSIYNYVLLKLKKNYHFADCLLIQ